MVNAQTEMGFAHSDLHFATAGRTRPHKRLKGKITKVRHFCRSQGLNCASEEWGGWDSNPGPADYESGPPSPSFRVPDLRRHELRRSLLARFGHVFGMIKLDAGLLDRPGSDRLHWP